MQAGTDNSLIEEAQKAHAEGKGPSVSVTLVQSNGAQLQEVRSVWGWMGGKGGGSRTSSWRNQRRWGEGGVWVRVCRRSVPPVGMATCPADSRLPQHTNAMQAS